MAASRFDVSPNARHNEPSHIAYSGSTSPLRFFSGTLGVNAFYAPPTLTAEFADEWTNFVYFDEQVTVSGINGVEVRHPAPGINADPAIVCANPDFGNAFCTIPNETVVAGGADLAHRADHAVGSERPLQLPSAKLGELNRWSQHRLVGRSVGVHPRLRRGCASRGSCGAGC